MTENEVYLAEQVTKIYDVLYHTLKRVEELEKKQEKDHDFLCEELEYANEKIIRLQYPQNKRVNT